MLIPHQTQRKISKSRRDHLKQHAARTFKRGHFPGPEQHPYLIKLIGDIDANSSSPGGRNLKLRISSSMSASEPSRHVFLECFLNDFTQHVAAYKRLVGLL